MERSFIPAVMDSIITCLWRRPNLTKRFLDYYRQRDFYRVCVTSPEDPYADTYDYTGWHRVEYTNASVSDKHTAGMKALKDTDVTGCFVLGSDDFMNDRYVEEVKKLNKDHVMINGMYFYDEATYRAAFLREAYCGAGRYISRKALEAMNFVGWPNKRNKSLDHSQTRLLENAGFGATMLKCTVDDDFGIVDVKSAEKQNIWSYDRIMRSKASGSKEWKPDSNALAIRVDKKHLDRLFEGWDEDCDSDVPVGA